MFMLVSSAVSVYGLFLCFCLLGVPYFSLSQILGLY